MGGGNLGVHSHTNPECRFTVWEELVMGGTCVAVPLSPLNKREVLKMPYIQIWCRCGYVHAPH